MLASSAYGGVCLLAVVFDETLPLFLQEDIANGGMGWTSNQIGILGSITGVVSLIYQLLLYPRVARKFGQVHALRYAFCLGLFYFFFFPLLQNVAELPLTLMWLSMILPLIPRVMVYATMFTCSIILVSNSAKPNQRGSVNGVAQSVASFVRALGPLLGGLVWTWSVSISFSLHNHIPYVIVTLICIANCVIAWQLPLSLNKPQSETKEIITE